MKNQYFGDHKDYLKYGLLRQLIRPGELTGTLCWMLTPEDRGPDGRDLRYLAQPERWRPHDPELFDLLRGAVRAGRRQVRVLEASGLLPGARYHGELLTDTPRERAGYFQRLAALARGCDLVFCDPDNGLPVQSVPPGRRGAHKYLYWSEAAALHRAGHSLLVFQFFPRVARAPYIARRVAECRQQLGAGEIWVIRTPAVAYFLLPQPGHRAVLAARLSGLARRWPGVFQIAHHPE